MVKATDMTGMKVGRLTVMWRATNDKFGMARWFCICDCGGSKIANGLNMRRGLTASCGCLHKERSSATLRKMNTKHGLSYTKRYKTHGATKYSLAKKNRTPAWANAEAIMHFYANTPEGCVVDHIIPLRGKLVSGLHVENNLQYLTRQQNQSKTNHYEVQ